MWPSLVVLRLALWFAAADRVAGATGSALMVRISSEKVRGFNASRRCR